VHRREDGRLGVRHGECRPRAARAREQC
jgi:hypothetical protein